MNGNRDIYQVNIYNHFVNRKANALSGVTNKTMC